jgi:tyrosyl-tRNA synthetase
VGDPSGKSSERNMLDFATLDANVAKFEQQARKFIRFDSGENRAILVNNLHFYENMNVLEFLRDVGKNITVNYMMAKDSVKNRLDGTGDGLSFTEFSYQLLQGYDYNALFLQQNCTVQMGGSDQFGNITTGTMLTRKISGGTVFAVTTPLLTKSDGTKFGKSEKGNLWLDPEMTTPFEFYQFWINADDADVPKYFRYFSLKSRAEIEAIETEDIRNQKLIIAEEITRRVHSDDDFERVMRVSKLLFDQKMSSETLQSMDLETIKAVQKEISSPILEVEAIENGLNIVDFLVKTNICQSNTDARNALKGNAISVNKSKISDANLILTKKDLLHDAFIFVENGKKNKFLVVV